jgi:hypothetical protein
LSLRKEHLTPGSADLGNLIYSPTQSVLVAGEVIENGTSELVILRVYHAAQDR